jgi:hypothetical protein
MGNEVEARAERVRDHLQRPDHSDWQLTNARIRSTVYLTVPSVPTSPGVYTIWQAEHLIYVGMAGRGVAVAEIDEAGVPTKKTRGLFGRLHTHANGRRSGDQFNVYVCDRFVVPELSADEVALLAEGRLNLDERTKAHTRRHFEYRYLVTDTGAEAADIESQVKRGVLGAGRPCLTRPSREQKLCSATSDTTTGHAKSVAAQIGWGGLPCTPAQGVPAQTLAVGSIRGFRPGTRMGGARLVHRSYVRAPRSASRSSTSRQIRRMTSSWKEVPEFS